MAKGPLELTACERRPWGNLPSTLVMETAGCRECPSIGVRLFPSQISSLLYISERFLRSFNVQQIHFVDTPSRAKRNWFFPSLHYFLRLWRSPPAFIPSSSLLIALSEQFVILSPPKAIFSRNPETETSLFGVECCKATFRAFSRSVVMTLRWCKPVDDGLNIFRRFRSVSHFQIRPRPSHNCSGDCCTWLCAWCDTNIFSTRHMMGESRRRKKIVLLVLLQYSLHADIIFSFSRCCGDKNHFTRTFN